MKKIYLLVALFAISYIGTAQVTAICNDTTVYLNGSGFYIIQDSDLDGGSTSPNMPLTFSATNPTFSCGQITDINAANSLIISAVYDGPLSGGTPKGIELYVINDISDLSTYGVGVANNGGGTDGQEYTFPADAVSAGSYIYITNSSSQFLSWFGFVTNYTSGSMAINGDDAIELFNNGSVIDVYGDVNTDGTGQPWEYLDGWAKRNDLQALNAGVFVDANWSYSGINALDGEVDNATAAVPVPVGVFTTPSNLGISTTLTVTDALNNTGTCVAQVIVLDSLAPTVTCVGGTPLFNLDASGDFTLQVSDIDNGSTDNCGMDSLYLSQYNFDCSHSGFNTVTLYGVDLSGNIDSCSMGINIDNSGVVTIDAVTSPPVTCNGLCDATLTITATNATLYSLDAGINTQVSPTFNGLCPGIYITWASNGNGCTTEFIQTIIEPTQVFVTNNNIEPSCNGICDGEIEVIATGGTPGYLYSIDGGITTSNSAVFNNLCDGTYILSVIDTNGCLDVTNVTTVLTQPMVIDVSTTVNGAVMSANETNGQYQWIDCSDNASINGETGQFYTAVQNGDYAVIVTQGNCSDTSSCIQITGVGINSNEIDVNIYPNPSNGKITVKLNSNQNLVSISDINGKVIKTIITTSKVTSFDLSDFENGIYFIKVETNKFNYTKKVSLIK